MAKKIKVEKEEIVEVKENSNLGSIFSWIFGVIFIFSGLVEIFTQFVAGFFMLLIGLFLLPPIKSLIYEKTGYKFGFWKTFGIVIVLIFLSGFISGLMGLNNSDNELNVENNGVSSETLNNINSNSNIEENIEIKTNDVPIVESTKEVEESSIIEEVKITLGEKNALSKAKTYLNTMAFSKEGLIQQLEFEGFTSEQAEYGVENSGADWFEQAKIKTKTYLNTMAFSRDGLIQQLEFEGFTSEQAKYGVENNEIDWNEQAALKAKTYLDTMAFSRDGLIQQLEFEGFTSEQAEYGAKAVGYE